MAMMSDEYLIVHKRILPDYYEKVIEARRLLETGAVKEVSLAVKQAGISRSTYYKYKDFVFALHETQKGRRAVLGLMLSHRPGTLSNVLGYLSSARANVLTITQSLPVHEEASVTLSLDIDCVAMAVESLVSGLARLPGVSYARLIAME